MFNASLSCRSAYEQLWQSSLIWRAVLQALGAPDAALRAVGFEEHGVNGRPPSAKALQSFARHWLLGIDLLVTIPTQVHVKPSWDSARALCSGRQHGQSFDLEDARKAVRAMQPEDGEALMQRASESLANLLRSRAPGAVELSKAESLLEAVADRSDIFTIAQMLTMLGANQEQALQEMPSDCCPPRHRNSRSSRRRGPRVADAQV